MRQRVLRAVLATVVLAAGGAPALADEARPTPKAVVYPGDVIRDDMLADLPPAAGPEAGGPFVESRAAVVGKAARLTLLPGRPIPYASVANRKLVVNGSEVKLLYAEGGLTIVTSGEALQDGVAGDLVRVRNSDSGVTVSGAVQPDGTVRVSGG